MKILLNLTIDDGRNRPYSVTALRVIFHKEYAEVITINDSISINKDHIKHIDMMVKMDE